MTIAPCNFTAVSRTVTYTLAATGESEGFGVASCDCASGLRGVFALAAEGVFKSRRNGCKALVSKSMGAKLGLDAQLYCNFWDDADQRPSSDKELRVISFSGPVSVEHIVMQQEKTSPTDWISSLCSNWHLRRTSCGPAMPTTVFCRGCHCKGDLPKRYAPLKLRSKYKPLYGYAAGACLQLPEKHSL